MNEYLVKKLKEGRINKGYKQSDVTKFTGIKNTTLSNYENGVTEPDIDIFLQLCELYGLDYASILGEAYGLNVQGTDFDIKPSEIEHIKKYRDLDSHGKEMVDFTLEKEYDRSVAECTDKRNIVKMPSHLEVVAAHERTDIEVTDEMRQHDDDIMDDDNF